jgi:outer membrane lipoprotein-sorting protein
MKTFSAFVLLLLAGSISPVFAQEFTTAQVLAKLDEKAKAFTTLEASLTNVQVVEEIKATPQVGKLYIKMANSVPRLLWDITEPKGQRMTILIDNGMLTSLSRENGAVKRYPIQQNQDLLQLLVIGFGISSSTLNKNYSAEAKGRQAVGDIQAVVLELKSITAATAKYPKITLFLDPQTWTPLRTRVVEKGAKEQSDYNDFNYSNIKLNKGVADSTFKLNIPSGSKEKK